MSEESIVKQALLQPRGTLSLINSMVTHVKQTELACTCGTNLEYHVTMLFRGHFSCPSCGKVESECSLLARTAFPLLKMLDGIVPFYTSEESQ